MKDLTITIGRISATRQGATASASVPGFKLRGFHGAVPHTPACERLWPAAADVLCDELAKIRQALQAAKTLVDADADTAPSPARETLARLLGELEIA